MNYYDVPLKAARPDCHAGTNVSPAPLIVAGQGAQDPNRYPYGQSATQPPYGVSQTEWSIMQDLITVKGLLRQALEMLAEIKRERESKP